jgi:hypothetical protein
VLATGNVYLQAIAEAVRVETARAQVETAEALYKKGAATGRGFRYHSASASTVPLGDSNHRSHK